MGTLGTATLSIAWALASATAPPSGQQHEPTELKSSAATAQPPQPTPPPPGPTKAEFETLLRRIEGLEGENAQMRSKIEELDQELKSAKKAADPGRSPRPRAVSAQLHGYVDVGFFYVNGNASGLRQDIDHQVFPEYRGVVPDEWVFLGDPLSTAINSRGDLPETANSRAVVFDPISNEGRASFIANALNLSVVGAAGKHLTVHGMVDFLPRNRNVADPNGVNLGDYIDIKHAFVSYAAPLKRVKLTLEVGKFDPVAGYEYRLQESPNRISVTPSLLCRYLCGRPLGAKIRSGFFRNSLGIDLAVTNGSSFTENYGFFNEIDLNNMKTFSGRVSYRLPVKGHVELGGSGLYGAQDLQSDESSFHWQAGADFHLAWAGVDLTAEFVSGRIRGDTTPTQPRCNIAPCLRYRGAYGLLGYRPLEWLMPYVRVDWNDSLHSQGGSFVYISDLIRATAGLRFDVGSHFIFKAEYTHIRELERVPQFRNDVVTSSLIAAF